MRHHSSVFAAALIVMAASTSAGAQAPAGPGVFGVYNPVTGTFKPATVQPVARAAGEVQPMAQVSRSGRVRFRIVIDVKSGSPASQLPSCQVNVSHNGVLHSYSEGQFVTGTRSGDSALCIVTIHYSWPEANSAEDVNLSLSVNISPRFHSESLPSIPLPANGALTKIVVRVTA